MSRLLLIPAVCCVLFLGCGKSGEGEAGAPAANPGQSAAGAPATHTNTAAVGGPQSGASSNPVTSFFTGLDRAAKGTGGVRR